MYRKGFTMKTILQYGFLAALLVLTACNGGNSLFATERLKSDAAYDMQQTLMGGQNFDLSRVFTLRMLVNGTRVDVTSLTPEVLALEGKERSRAATVMAFSQDRSQVIMFTRDPQTGEGYVRKVGVNELKNKPVIEFPLVVGNTVTTAKFEVMDLTVLP